MKAVLCSIRWEIHHGKEVGEEHYLGTRVYLL